MKTLTHLLRLVCGFLSLAITVGMAQSLPPIDPSAYGQAVRITCVGDSITQGSGAAKGKSYPSQLQGLLGPSWKVSNFGVSARTLLSSGDFPYIREKAYQKALKSKPDIVIIMLGTNDTKAHNWQHKEEFSKDYAKLVRAFLELESKPRVYVCRPCPVVGEGNFGINDKNLQEAIRHIDDLAVEMKLGVIDMQAALKGMPELLPDRVHPNTQGATAMAKAAYQVLTGKPAPE